MAGRSGINESVAFKAMSACGRQVLQVIQKRAQHGGATITLGEIMEAGMCRCSARAGIKQCQLLGFVNVTAGPRKVGRFELADGWKAVVDAYTAKKVVKASKMPAQRQSRSSSPSPANVAPLEVKDVLEQPPASIVRQPSLPSLRWMDAR
jgi:hypothetical protein